MNKKDTFRKGRPYAPLLQEYRNRDYVLSELDETVFDILNDGSGDTNIFIFASGCLDALYDMPAGSTRALPSGNNTCGHFYGPSTFERERTLAEVKEFEKWMEELDVS